MTTVAIALHLSDLHERVSQYDVGEDVVLDRAMGQVGAVEDALCISLSRPVDLTTDVGARGR